jgi:hypothetical protein
VQHLLIRCGTVLAIQQRTTRHQYATHLLQCRDRVGNGAQGERHHHGIEAGIVERNPFRGQPDQLDLHATFALALFCQSMHLHGRVKTDQFRYLVFIVMAQVEAGADTDFQHTALRQRHHFLALAMHRFDAAGQVNHVRQDMPVVPVVTHAQS